MILIIWISLIVLFYIYFGYLITLLLCNKITKKQKIKKDDEYIPEVSLIISAYNEEDIIEEKINNTLSLDYPEDKLEIIITNDGSKDRTAELIKRYPQIKLLNFNINQGKTITQNIGVKEASGEIIIFSDANSMYQPDALKKLVRNFADNSVGGVCGELIYREDTNTKAGEGEGLYWNYEKIIKKAESSIASVLGNNGAIYALRKEIYTPLPEDIISDFVEPLMVIKQGYKNVYEEEAVAIEKPEGNFKKEFNRKVRIVTRGIRGLIYSRELLKPNFIGFGLVSHKLLRWLAPVFLIILFASNLLYHSGVYFYLLIGQVIFYLLALLGLKYKKRLFYIPTYFTLVNVASLVGIFHFIMGKKYVSWDTAER